MPRSAGIPTDNLRDFVAFCEERGELIRITEPVDPCLEVTEIADRFVKDGTYCRRPVRLNTVGSVASIIPRERRWPWENGNPDSIQPT